MEMVAIILGWILIMGGIGAGIGSNRGNATAGFFLGVLLGFIGWIIAAVMSRTPENEAEYQRRVAAATGVALPGEQVPAQWASDPFGRYSHRWWNGSHWTNRVAKRGEEAIDEPTYPVPYATNKDGSPIRDGWADDPFGRFPKREYKNKSWTHLVAQNAETVLSDPPLYPAPIPPPPID